MAAENGEGSLRKKKGHKSDGYYVVYSPDDDFSSSDQEDDVDISDNIDEELCKCTAPVYRTRQSGKERSNFLSYLLKW